jgi:hypothetical protein
MNEYFFSYKETYVYKKDKNIEHNVITNFINNKIMNYKYIQELYIRGSFDVDSLVLKYADPYYSWTTINQHIYTDLYISIIPKNKIFLKPPESWNYNYMYYIYISNANVNKNTKICAISNNEGTPNLLDMLKYSYDFYYKHEHVPSSFNYRDDTNENEDEAILYIKNMYNIPVIKYDTNNFNTKYDIIIYHATTSIYVIETISKYNTIINAIKQRENINCRGLQDLYNALDNLNIGGDLLFYYPIISNNCSLLMIESIIQCFEYVSLMNDRLIQFINGNMYICKNYKGKKKLLKHNTIGFCNFIIKVFKINGKNNNKILLTRLGVDIILKYFPYCLELENKYLLNKHNGLLLLSNQEYEKERINQQIIDIRKDMAQLFNQMCKYTNNYSIEINIPCTLIYDDINNLLQIIPGGPCNIPYNGIFYDINISTPHKKNIKELTQHNKLFRSRKRALISHPKYNDFKHYLEIKFNFFDALTNMEVDMSNNTFVYIDKIKGITQYLKHNNIKYTNHNTTIKNKCIDIMNKWIVAEATIHNILYSMHNLNIGDGLMMQCKLPINKKILWDFMYIVYCSFEVIYLDTHNETLYIACHKFKKNMSTEQLLQKTDLADKLNDDISIIIEPYVPKFIETFGSAINCYIFMLILRIEILTHILVNEIPLDA